jgi:hypothetical protein
MNIDIEAHSPFFYDADFYGAELRKWAAPSSGEMTVIASDEDSVTLSFSVSVEVAAEATFTLSVRDSLDGDHISIGGASVVRDIDLEVPIVLRVARDGGPDGAIIDINTEGGRYVILDFGYVEPDHDEEG